MKDKKINPNIWRDPYNYKFEAYPFFTSVYFASNTASTNKYEARWKHFLAFYKDGQLDGYLPRKEYLETGEKIISELLSGKDDFLKALVYQHEKDLSIINACLRHKKNNKINFELIWPKIKDALSVDTKLLVSFDLSLNDYLVNVIKPKNNDLFDAISSNAVAIEEESFMNEAIYRLQELVVGNPDNFGEVCNKFIEEFGWFQNSYKGVFNMTKEWLAKFYDVNKDKKEKVLAEKKKIDQKYQLLVEVAQRGIKFRDDKKKLLLVAVPIMDFWLEDVCKKNNWNKKEMLWLSVDEIKKILNKGDKILLSKARKSQNRGYRCGIQKEDGFDDVDISIWNEVVKINLSKTYNDIITGLTGNGGKIVGKVRVVLDIEKQGKDFVEGEILITSMTRPEYLPLMSKASAFITDEGGLTCHAAIVAREMHKPCIIGTKIATRVLKDGDLVEVDAERGVVKILKKNNE